MKTVPLNQATNDITNLINETNSTKTPILITGETENAVLISESEWNAIQETLYLQSIPNMTESILEGGKIPVEDCIKLEDLDW